MQLMMAEMEQRKAENLILHQDEIHARAPRTWIVSAQQKEASKGVSASMFSLPDIVQK